VVTFDGIKKDEVTTVAAAAVNVDDDALAALFGRLLLEAVDLERFECRFECNCK